VKNFDGLAAQSAEGKRGKRRGDWGLFIGMARAGNRQGVMRIEEGE
jgi:hypothetical protein